MTARQFMAQLRDDPEYQARSAEKKEVLEQKASAWREAARPIVADLAAAGVEVDSPWDLVNTSTPYPAALPVLMNHLKLGGYPDRVLEGLARALAVKPAAPYWSELAELYRKAPGPDEREGLAVALAACVTSEHIGELADLVSDIAIGPTRIHLIRPLARMEGSIGRDVLSQLRDDPEIGPEVQRVLKRR